MQFAEANLVFRKIDNLRSDLAAATIEKNGAVAVFHAQHIAGVMRLSVAQSERVGIPVIR
jgi:hypothetical protein